MNGSNVDSVEIFWLESDVHNNFLGLRHVARASNLDIAARYDHA